MKKKVMSFILAAVMVAGMSTSAMASSVSEEGDTTIPGTGEVNIEGSKDCWIDVTIPSGFTWWVTTGTNNRVESLKYSIINNSDRGVLDVSLEEFSQTNSVSVNGLKLNLTGDLAKENIVGHNTTYTYPSKLGSNSEWEFSFDGTYTGNYYPDALTPQYNMILNFKLAYVEPAK